MDLGIVLIVVLLLVGPGAIAVGILILSNGSTWTVAFLNISLAFLITYLYCTVRSFCRS